jgi:hypothetical protein
VGASRYLFGLLVAVAVGVAIYSIGQRLVVRRSPPANGARLEGFAGWLLVLAIGQWLAVLGLFAEILRRLPFYHRSLEMPETRTIVVAQIVVHLAMLAFVLGAALLMTRKRRLYPPLLRIELVLLVLLPALNGIWASEETATFVTGPKHWIAIALRFAVGGIVAALLFLYAQHSLRLRNTFVR